MKVEILERFAVLGVPRSTCAPWLSKNSRKWELTSDLVLMIDGDIWQVPKGYVFDGSTIPRALWWIWPPTVHFAWVASCFHDRCYSHLYKQVEKDWADEVFKQIMLLEGAGRFRANVFYAGVRLGGKGGW